MATRVLSSTSLRQNKMLTQLTTPLNGKHEDVLTWRQVPPGKSKGLPPTEAWQSIVRVKMACTLVAVPYWSLSCTLRGSWIILLVQKSKSRFMNPRFDKSETVSPNFHPNFSSGPGQWNTSTGGRMCSCHTVHPNEGIALIGHRGIRTWRMVWESVNQEASFTRGKYKHTCHSQ